MRQPARIHTDADHRDAVYGSGVIVSTSGVCVYDRTYYIDRIHSPLPFSSKKHHQ